MLGKKYDVLIDKGTYDAISLCPDDAPSKRQSYVENLCKLMKPTGVCWMTSCNWTASELIEHYTSSSRLRVREEVPVKQFTFGGQVGQTVCCVVFELNEL